MKNIFLAFSIAASMLCAALSAMEIPKQESVDQEAVKEVDLKQRAKVAMGQFLLPPELLEHILSFVSYGMQKTQAKDWARCAVVNKEFNTLAHAWLPGNLQESGEYTLFKQVMKLRTIAAEVAQKSLAAGEVAAVELDKEWQDPNYYSQRTHKGLVVDMGLSYPQALITPWGTLPLYHDGVRGVEDDEIEEDHQGLKALSARFLAHFSVTFHDIPVLVRPQYYATPLVEWSKPDHALFQEQYRVIPVTRTSLSELYRKTPMMVYSDWVCIGPDFAIDAIDGEKVEEHMCLYSEGEERSCACMGKLWSLLQKMYREEQGSSGPRLVHKKSRRKRKMAASR